MNTAYEFFTRDTDIVVENFDAAGVLTIAEMPDFIDIPVYMNFSDTIETLDLVEGFDVPELPDITDTFGVADFGAAGFDAGCAGDPANLDPSLDAAPARSHLVGLPEDHVPAVSRLTRIERQIDVLRGAQLADLCDEVHGTAGRTSDAGLEIEAFLTEIALETRRSYGELARLLTVALVTRRGVQVGESNVPLEGVGEAWRSGLLDARHVDVIAQEMSMASSAELAVIVRDNLLEMAMSMTAFRLERTARRLREQTDPLSLVEAHRKAIQDRCVQLEPLADGMARLSIVADAVTLVAAVNRNNVMAKRIQRQEGELGHGLACVPDVNGEIREQRTLLQIRTDMMTELLIGGVTVDDNVQQLTGSTVSQHVHATVSVTVPAITLMGLDEVPAELDGYGPIAADTARTLIANTIRDQDDQHSGHDAWFRILTHPVTGIPLIYDRMTYAPPDSLRRYIQHRDKTCRFPGCQRPAKVCDIDHTYDWQFGGQTNADNLACLCRRHHMIKHHTDWSVAQVGDGTLRWTAPSGAVFVTYPRNDIPATTADVFTRRESEALSAAPPF